MEFSINKKLILMRIVNFYGVCKVVWEKAKVIDSKFRTNQHKSHVDLLADEKLATAFKNEVLKPYV